tara:strand:+ start:386 stop:1039 length:654 start_codon:yes stop_codon:yes gene_type:complete
MHECFFLHNLYLCYTLRLDKHKKVQKMSITNARSGITTNVDLNSAFKDNLFFGADKTEGKQAANKMTLAMQGVSGSYHTSAHDIRRMSHAAMLSAQKTMLTQAWNASTDKQWSFSDAVSWVKDTSRQVMGLLGHNFTSYKALSSEAQGFSAIAANFNKSPSALGNNMAALKTGESFELLAGVSIIGNLAQEASNDEKINPAYKPTLAFIPAPRLAAA